MTSNPSTSRPGLGHNGGPVFPYEPHEYQLEVHKALAYYRFVVVVAHRRWGKTECAIASLVLSAATCEMQDGMYGYIAPYLKQAKAIAWRKLKRIVNAMFPNWREAGVEKNEAELWIQLPNGARIQLYGADNADAMRGLYFDGVVIDEIADMKADVWNGVIRPALADRKGWAMMIGTPKGMNELYKFYMRGQKDPLWKSLMYAVTMTKLPWLPPEEIMALENDMTEAMFAQEMLCDFQASSDDVLFKLTMLHACATLQLRLSDVRGAAKVIGVDVAGPEKGSDRTVFTKKQGQMIWPQIVTKGKNTPEICDQLQVMMMEWGADAAIIDKGRGFAVVEEMQRRGFHNVYGVDFGGKAIQPQYKNKKTEMFYRTLKAMKAGLKIPADEELFAELAAHTVRLDEKGKLTVLEKDKVKELLRRSPDKCDSLILCHAFDVVPIQLNPLDAAANPSKNDDYFQSKLMTGGSGVQIEHDPYGD